MKPPAVLLDLGGALVRYAGRRGFAAILEAALADVGAALGAAGLPAPAPAEVRARSDAEASLASERSAIAGRITQW